MINRDMGVNERIRLCRKERELTQTRVAKVLGIKTCTYSQLERKGYVTCETLKILSQFLMLVRFICCMELRMKTLGVQASRMKADMIF